VGPGWELTDKGEAINIELFNDDGTYVVNRTMAPRVAWNFARQITDILVKQAREKSARAEAAKKEIERFFTEPG